MQSRLGLSCAMKSNSIRSLSSVASAPKLDFAVERGIYKKQVGGIRKQWKSEIEERIEKARLERIEEGRKKTLVSAVRLRRERADHVIKEEIARKTVLASKQAARERLELSHVKFREKQARQQRRYAMAIADLEEEKEQWITHENIENKINLSLFETPATTGLTTRYSDFWRYSAYTTDLDRMRKNEEDRERFGDDMKTRRIEIDGERELVKRIEMIQFLDQSVSSGAERANFKNLVNEFLDHVALLDAEDHQNSMERDYGDYDEDFDRPSEIDESFLEDFTNENDMIAYDGSEDGERSFDDYVPPASENADNEGQEFVDELLPERFVEDPGDYKKKVVEIKKKTAGRKKK